MSELSQTEEVNTPFLHLFVLFGPSTDWVRPTHNGEGNLLYSVYRFKCWSLPETPSQTYSEIMFSQISEYPMAQSNWHIKLIITSPNPISRRQFPPLRGSTFALPWWSPQDISSQGDLDEIPSEDLMQCWTPETYPCENRNSLIKVRTG